MALVLKHNGAPVTGALFMKNPKRKHALRRNEGYKLNGKKRRGLNRRNPADFSSLPVLGGAVDSGVRTVQGLASKVPYVGGTLSEAVPALLVGVVAGGAMIGGTKLLSRYMPSVASHISPVAYSATGVAIAVAINKLPIPGDASLKNSVALAAMALGAGTDLIRWFRGNSGSLSGIDEMGDSDIDGIDDMGDYDTGDVDGLAMGDGGRWEIGELEGIDDMSDPDVAGLHSHYADASLGDAFECGSDISADEGNAALQGAGVYFGTFGAPPARVQRRMRNRSRHAGKKGHKWAWLIKLIGFKNFQSVSAMEPEARKAYIAKIRQYAIANVNASEEREDSVGGLAMSGLAMSGLAMGDSFGALMAGSSY